jgi:indolepyruvate ferredoxin oxidoreductase beta subunit
MAQRGSVVESMVLLGDGKGYCISDGSADVMSGFKPSETILAVGKCSANTLVVSNTAPVPPFTVALGKACYPDVQIAMPLLGGRVKKLIAFDATSLVLNMVMLGATARSGAVPLSQDLFVRVIKEKTKKQFVDVNLNAFEMGMQAFAKE